MKRLPELVRRLNECGVRFVVIGVSGANLWALGGGTVFTTEDYDVFLPLDPGSVLRAWQACESMGLSLFCDLEPLDVPRDHVVADAVVSRRAAVRATDGQGFDVDLTLVMAGFDFETVWTERREFAVEGVAIPVARLRHIVHSKTLLGRDKDRLFLATHADVLEQLFPKDD